MIVKCFIVRFYIELRNLIVEIVRTLDERFLISNIEEKRYYLRLNVSCSIYK